MDIMEVKEGVTLEEQAKTLFNVSIKDVVQLKAWLEASGRRWLIFDSLELADALPFPDGLDTLIQIIAVYRDHRRAISSGEVVDGMPRMKDEILEVAEMDRVIRFLYGKITERDSAWAITNPPM